MNTLAVAPISLAEWFLYTYRSARLLKTDEEIEKLIEEISESTEIPAAEIRQEIRGIIRDVRRLPRDAKAS